MTGNRSWCRVWRASPATMQPANDPREDARSPFFPSTRPHSVREHLPVHLTAHGGLADRSGARHRCQRTVLAVVPVVLLVVLGSCAADAVTSTTTPRPTEARPTPSWRELVGEIRSASTLVVSATHEPDRDFVRIVVPDGTNVATASSLGCQTIQRILREANAFAFFAIYTESGRILSSWSACRQATPTPSS